MSTQFALLLNMPITRLLVAAENEWQVVAEAALDGDDLAGAFESLRAAGEEIAGGPFSCMLILPDDQIRYLKVPAGPDDATAAMGALEGATPYAVSDLAYDWAREGDELAIAAVARETLQEADGFVRDQGLTPAGFIAAPAPTTFPTRPVFDSPELARGAPLLPIGGAFKPSPPPAFASRRPAPPLAAPSVAEKAPARPEVASRISLSATPATAGASAAALSAPARQAPSASAQKAPPAAHQTDKERKQTGNQIGGKPRYLGLMLTLGLLVLLALVALWSSTLGGDETASLPEDLAPESAEITPEVEAEMASDIADLEAPEDIAILDDEALTPTEPLPSEPAQDSASLEELPDIDAPTEELLPALPAPARPPQPLTDTELAAQYATTGIWQRAPRISTMPRAGSLDQLYVASIDPQVQPADAIALPAIEALRQDALPVTPLPPAAPDQTYALGEDGRVIATPEGALSPEGVLVYAGRPPVTVPLRAESEAPEEAVPEPDLSLAALRPVARPDDLQDNNERAQLGGRTLEELASIRPQMRPKAPQELAAEIAAAAAAAAAAVENAPVREDPLASGTALAAATSPKPQTRPRNFARIVERAQTRQQEAPAASGRTVASVAPRSVQPSGPVPTTVSRAATMENAINLRRINLIGVYGKPSSRSALVRLRNGRFKKVKVGDRIDGGRVAAIGESELRYVKSGRNLTLTIPSS